MQNPETLTDFDNILTVFNELRNTEIKFENSWNDPDIICVEESTADGYSVWVLKEEGQSISPADDVYYYEPSVNDLFDICGYQSGLCNVYTNISHDQIQDYMLEELFNDYENYLEAQEDAKS